ncbi:MAG: DUF1329 domain-containing protein [Myxococcota bacterium]
MSVRFRHELRQRRWRLGPVLHAALLLLAWSASAQETLPSPWALPEPGDCGAARDSAEDALPAPFPLSPGDVVGFEELAALERYLPAAVWRRRDAFFFEGMRIEIGPCFRSYTPPAFFAEATRAFAGRARLLPDGGLADAPAGLPFPPTAIAPDDPQAGQKWAWNAVRRYRGAGRFGELRVTYLEVGQETAHLVGRHFVALLMGRADLAETSYGVPWQSKRRWVSGGTTRDPSSGSRCAFRHYRAARAASDADSSDDVFLRSSATRKTERVRWDAQFPLLFCAYERGVYFPHGGKVGRYRWRVAGVRDLVAPINAVTPAYPEDPTRSFGPSGASLARDRWELRRTLVLEAPLGAAGRVRRFVDLETLFPLYQVENPGGGDDLILQYAGRWSEDRASYARWPDAPKRPVRAIDPVVQVRVGGSEVVRVETWDAVAVPPEERSLRRLTSQSSLARAR